MSRAQLIGPESRAAVVQAKNISKTHDPKHKSTETQETDKQGPLGALTEERSPTIQHLKRSAGKKLTGCPDLDEWIKKRFWAMTQIATSWFTKTSNTEARRLVGKSR